MRVERRNSSVFAEMSENIHCQIFWSMELFFHHQIVLCVLSVYLQSASELGEWEGTECLEFQASNKDFEQCFSSQVILYLEHTE